MAPISGPLKQRLERRRGEPFASVVASPARYFFEALISSETRVLDAGRRALCLPVTTSAGAAVSAASNESISIFAFQELHGAFPRSDLDTRSCSEIPPGHARLVEASDRPTPRHTSPTTFYSQRRWRRARRSSSQSSTAARRASHSRVLKTPPR